MNNKETVAEIILNTNKYEYFLKGIISEYVDAKNSEFLDEIMLNNLIVNLGTKVKLIKIIAHQLKAFSDKEVKDFNKASHIVLSKRNIIAHSDSLSKSEQIFVGFDVDWNLDGVIEYPMFEEVIVDDVEIIDRNTGEISTEKLDKTYNDFMKYYKKTLEFLSELCAKLPSPSTTKVNITEELAQLN